MSSAEERLRHNFAGFTVSENAGVHAGDRHYTEINNYSSQERPASPVPVRPFINIPFPPDPDYIERTAISDEIHRKLVPGARLALVGLGGVGKSQLAIKTAYQVRETSPETFVFWLHAGSTARLKQSIENTLEQVQEPRIGDLTANVFQLFRAWLLDRKQRRKWLIVLDNADNAQLLRQSPSAPGDDKGQESEQYLDYLPVCEHGTLLATSRNRAAALQIVSPNDIVNIGPMNEMQGLAMLQQKLGPNIIHSVDELSQLATELDSMPLAMSQAAAYIRQRAPRCSVREYLDKLTSHKTRLDVLNHNTQDLRRDREAQHCIFKTWQISFDHIRKSRSSAADLLSLMSFFDRNSIPEALLHKRDIETPISGARLFLRNLFGRHTILKSNSHRKRDKQQALLTRDPRAHSGVDDKVTRMASPTGEEPIPNLDDDIQLLRDYSMVTVITDSPSFQMHRLVQLATQDWLKATESFERWGSQFIMNLDEALDIPKFVYHVFVFDEDREICQPFFPHALAATEIELNNREFALRQASLLDRVAWRVHSNGAFTDGQRMYEQALKIRTELLGPEHVDTIDIMRSLGGVYIDTQQYEKAETMLAEALNLAERLLGEHHEVTLAIMNRLATAYYRTGKLVDAETMQINILHKQRKNYGEDEAATLHAMMDLSETVSRRGRHSEAEDLANRALSIARELYYPLPHPRLLNAQICRAIIQHRAGRFEEARRSFNEVFPYLEVQGVYHPATLTAMYWLAKTIYQLDQRRSAIDLLRDCVEKSERELGPHDVGTIERYQVLRDWEAEDEPRTTAREQEETGTDDGSDTV